MSINKVLISGNLTRDAEQRTTQSGTTLITFGVAVNDRRRNAQGEWEDYANYVDCTMFGRRAEAICQYLTKGVKVAIEGKLRYSSWEDRNGGGRRSKLDVTVDELEFMSSRNGGQGGNQGYAQQPSYNSAPQTTFGAPQAAPSYEQPRSVNIPPAPTPSAYNDEDIPF